MTTSGQAEEIPFLAGMEREPEEAEPGYRDVTVTLPDSWSLRMWRADGFIHRMLDSLSALGGKVRSMAEQGPKDYAESEFERGMKAGARYGGYHEAPKNGGSSWNKWMMTLCGALAVIGIGGGIGMYGKLSAVEANQINQQKQLDNLSQMVLNLTRRSQ